MALTIRWSGIAAVLSATSLVCVQWTAPVWAAETSWTALVDQAEQKNLQGSLKGAEEKFREALLLATNQHAGAPELHQLKARLACAMVLQEKLDQAQPLCDELSRVSPTELLNQTADDEMYYFSALADAYRTIGYRLSGKEKLRCLENNLLLRDLVMGKRSNLAVPVSELLISRVLNDQFEKAVPLGKRLNEEIKRSKDGDARNAASYERIALAYQLKGKTADAAPFDAQASSLYKKIAAGMPVELSKEREAVRFCLEWKLLPEGEKHALNAIRLAKPPIAPIVDYDLLAMVYAAKGRYDKSCEAYEHILPALNSTMSPMDRIGYLRRYAGCLKQVHRDKEAAKIIAQCTEVSVQDLKKK